MGSDSFHETENYLSAVPSSVVIDLSATAFLFVLYVP